MFGDSFVRPRGSKSARVGGAETSVKLTIHVTFYTSIPGRSRCFTFFFTDGEADAVFLYASYYLKTCSPVSFQGLRRPIDSLSSLVPDVCSTVRCGFGTSKNRTDTSKLTFGTEFSRRLLDIGLGMW